MYTAHIKPVTYEKQSVKEHLLNVAINSKKNGAKAFLGDTAEIIGILHDMGKETKLFDSYIHYSSKNPEDKSLKGSIDHSTAGARYIYEKFYNTDDLYQKLTAQLISLAICSHHGGLIDCLDLNGADKYSERMRKEKDIHYAEAVSNFENECKSIKDIDRLFMKAKEEIKTVMKKVNQINMSAKFGQFAVGFIEKYIFSCLIDADRNDTYEFMGNKEQRENINKKELWDDMSSLLDEKLDNFPKDSDIDLLRGEISKTCKEFAANKPGIYHLSVPTGGGKTLSSLRYALNHARLYDKDRIFYIIPFTTIIDQNAKEIKEILGHEDLILEHHSNLVLDNNDEVSKYLTETWDNPIILTTMVQFLETLFKGGTQSLRKLHNLANSIIIFDEIQSIPIKCINMFNSAINVLSYICNTTIVLCTATQPLLTSTKMPLIVSENSDIIPNVHERFKQFKRVNLIDESIIGGYSIAELKDFVKNLLNKVNSILVILNTRKVVKELYKVIEEENKGLPEKERYIVFHLSTYMCPNHRINILKDIKTMLGTQKIICISTQLIEAGVNISFECVIRSVAGLDSIAQAAGRCNRHGEVVSRDSYIVNIENENIGKLIDIRKGRECTERILHEFKENPDMFDNDMLSPNIMERYYQYYFLDRKEEMDYTLPQPNKDKTMYDLLSSNANGMNAYTSRNGQKPDLMMKQAFKTAGDNFKAIDQNTVGVIVPYKYGEKLITLINGNCNLCKKKKYLKLAQQFSVNLYEVDIKRLEEAGGIVKILDGAALSLRAGFYKNDVGVVFDGGPMGFLNV